MKWKRDQRGGGGSTITVPVMATDQNNPAETASGSGSTDRPASTASSGTGMTTESSPLMTSLTATAAGKVPLSPKKEPKGFYSTFQMNMKRFYSASYI